MKKEGMKTITMMLIALMMVLSPVTAALCINVVTDEFSVGSPYPVDTVKECHCGTRTEIVEVQNVGDFRTQFDVELNSPMIQYMTLSEPTFSLAPGEMKRLQVYINAPCGQDINSFYEVIVHTNYGRTKTVSKNFESKHCQNIQVTSQILNATVKPNECALVRLKVENTGSYDDSYNVYFDNNQPYVDPSEASFGLRPGEVRTLTTCVQLPSDACSLNNPTVYQHFTVTSKNGMNSVTGVEHFDIDRSACDFSVKTSELDLNVCEDVTTNERLTIYNLGTVDNSYDIMMSAPKFVQLDSNNLSIEAGDDKSVNLNINPTQLDIGQYEVKLLTKSQFGNFVKEKNIKLNVQDCYDSTVTINGYNGLSDKDCCQDKQYPLKIVNNGLYQETYQLIVDSEGWVTIDKANEFVTLNPGEEAIVPVYGHLPCADENRTSYVVVKQTKAPYQTHEIRIDLQSLSPRSCYNVDLVQQTYKANCDTNTVPLILKNNGMRGGEYDVSIGDTSAGFLTLAENKVTLNPGEMRVVTAQLPANYSACQEGRYLNKLTLDINPSEPCDYDNIDYQRQFWIELREKNFFEKAWDWIKGINYTKIGFCGYFGLFLLLLAIVMLVFGLVLKKSSKVKVKRIKQDTMKKIKNFNMILVVLLLLALIALVFLGSPNDSRFYENESGLAGPLYHEWKQNTQYRLDLAPYFTDPDLDVLSYTASQPDHVDVKIDGSQVKLTPEFGWSGTEYIVFGASDGKGGVAESTVMTLHVIKKKPTDFLDLWSLYCSHVNLVLFVILCLLALMITNTIEEKGYTHYLANKNK